MSRRKIPSGSRIRAARSRCRPCEVSCTVGIFFVWILLEVGHQPRFLLSVEIQFYNGRKITKYEMDSVGVTVFSPSGCNNLGDYRYRFFPVLCQNFRNTIAAGIVLVRVSFLSPQEINRPCFRPFHCAVNRAVCLQDFSNGLFSTLNVFACVHNNLRAARCGAFFVLSCRDSQPSLLTQSPCRQRESTPVSPAVSASAFPLPRLL